MPGNLEVTLKPHDPLFNLTSYRAMVQQNKVQHLQQQLHLLIRETSLISTATAGDMPLMEAQRLD